MSEALLRRWREYRRRGIMRRMAGARLLRAFAAAYPEAVFIEIGAHDGEQHDHLRPHIRSGHWRGVMVEPVPYVFERLRANYGGLARVVLENLAIADHDGSLPFHHLAEVNDPESAGLPTWYDALGSLSRQTLLTHLAAAPHLERFVVTARVPCLTLPSLCEKHGLVDLDLIAIDTEGYDAEILAQLDLESLRPRLVVFEHYHLPREVRESCRRRLEEAGYETMEEHFDTFCLDTSSEDRLTKRFRRLRPLFPGVAAEEERCA